MFASTRSVCLFKKPFFYRKGGPMQSWLSKSSLCLGLLFSMGFSASPVQSRLSPHNSTLASRGFITQPSHHNLAKSATALAYVPAGSAHFTNSGSESEPVWTLSSRDTSIYNAAGNIILFMTSRAQSGWKRDSVILVDSTIYTNGKISENIRKYTYFHYDAERTTIAYLNNGKTLLKTNYLWDDSAKTWILPSKDSLVYSSPVSSNATGINYNNLTGLYYFADFDATTGIWREIVSLEKVAGECTSSSLVLKDTSFKTTLSFASSDWTEENITERLDQLKDSATGIFVNSNKFIRVLNANGDLLREDSFFWDAEKSAWIPFLKLLYFPDAHGNDTLYCSFDYDSAASSWYSSGTRRYVRTYDVHGNNTLVITSSSDSLSGIWRLLEKTVNTFAQINTPARFSGPPVLLPGFAVKANPSSIKIDGRNIVGLDLYNAAGRSVLFIQQKPSADLSLNLKGNGVSIPAGVYIAQLRTTSGKYSIRLPICP
jgi:hypothetical protein